MMYTLNIYNVIYPLHLNTTGGKQKTKHCLKLNSISDQNLCYIFTDLTLAFQVNSEVCLSFHDCGLQSQEQIISLQEQSIYELYYYSRIIIKRD